MPLVSVREVAVPGFVILRRNGIGMLEGNRKVLELTNRVPTSAREAGGCTLLSMPEVENENSGSEEDMP